MIDRSRKIMLTRSLIAGGLAAAIAAASLGVTPAAAQGYYGNGYYNGGGYPGTPLVGLLPWNWGGTYGGYGNGGYGNGGYYVPATPMMTGRSVATEMPGDYCSTPVKTCLLTQTSFVGNGCSCRVAPGRSRGEVVR